MNERADVATDPALTAEIALTADQWSQRLQAVQFHNEPALYVTPEEFRQLRQVIDRIAYERSLTDLRAPTWRPTNLADPIVSMTGFPVVVDTEEAARQARLTDASGGTDG